MGDVWAGAKGNIDEAIESADSMNEQLVSGVWTERAEGVGPQPTLVVDAIWRALGNTSTDGGVTTPDGKLLDEARKAAILAQCKDKAVRDGALKDPAIAAQYAAIQSERAAERAAKAAEAAKGLAIGATTF